jgi:hypothetical protein
MSLSASKSVETIRVYMETFKFFKHKDYVDLIALNLFALSETFPKDRNPNRWGVIIDNSGYGYRVLNGLQPHEAEELAKEMYNKVNLMLSNRFMEW